MQLFALPTPADGAGACLKEIGQRQPERGEPADAKDLAARQDHRRGENRRER